MPDASSAVAPAEVVVDEAVVHTGLRGEVAPGDRVRCAFGEQVGGGGDERCSRAFRVSGSTATSHVANIAHMRDWATDYDIFDPLYVADPFTVWDDLRDRCPVAHTEQWGGSWLPTTYATVTAIARDVEHFSSRNVSVVGTHGRAGRPAGAACRCAADQLRPARAHMGPAAHPALVLARPSRGVRDRTRARCAVASSTGSSTRVVPMPQSGTRSRSPCE